MENTLFRDFKAKEEALAQVRHDVNKDLRLGVGVASCKTCSGSSLGGQV